MAYTRAAAKLIIDNPNADGQVITWGIGRDWEAAEEKAMFRGLSADLAGQYGWLYNGQFEYLEKLKAIAPIGRATFTDMALADWTPTQGAWAESSKAGALRTTHLHFYDTRPGLVALNEYGILTSKDDYLPNLALSVWRFPASNEETDPCVFEVHFLGAGTGPVYALSFPASGPGGAYYSERFGQAGAQYTSPALIGRLPGQSTWTVIDEWKGGGAPQQAHGLAAKAYFQGMRIEYADGWLLVRVFGTNETWAYSGAWRDSSGNLHDFSLGPGKIEIRVAGHTAMFALTQLAYPSAAVLLPSAYFFTVPPVNPVPSYSVIGSAPLETAIGVTADEFGNGTRPGVLFTSSGGMRAVLYNVQEYREATVGNAQSNPLTTVGNPALQLVSIRGELTSAWRGATLDAELKAAQGETLPELKTNDKVEAAVSLDGGTTWVRQFVGYNVPLEKYLETEQVGRVRAKLHAASWDEARGRKKVLLWNCSFEGWAVDAAFRYLLNRAGVPDSLIDVHADVSVAKMGAYYYLPVGNPKGERLLQFRQDESLVSALDQIAKLRGLEWGADQDGKCFLRPPLVHTPGYADFTISDESASSGDFRSFRRVRSGDDYFNCLLVLAGEGFNMAARLWQDAASITEPTYRDYVGDDWWRVEMQPEGDNVQQIAARLWQGRTEGADLIYWKTSQNPELLPDMYLKVQVSGMDIPSNSIYRITRKAWQVDDPEGAGRYSQEIEAVLVEVGS